MDASFVEKLFAGEPAKGALPEASVSVILRGGSNPSVLLIRRAERDGDPWSGQVAFPGGKARPGEATLKETAMRETAEEVGIDLARSADFLGYNGQFLTHTGTMTVTPAVFRLRREVAVTPNDEVASYKWVGLDVLLSRESRFDYAVPVPGETRVFPALKVEDYVVWGLTHRILLGIFGAPQD